MSPRKPPSKPDQFKQALEWFREKKKNPLRRPEFDLLSSRARLKASTIADVTNLELISSVYREMEKAIAKGTTFAEFKKKVAAKLAEEWGENRPWHVANIFRTNTQAAYGQGRWLEFNRPETRLARPYFRYSAILDARTSDICRRLHGTTLHAAHPFWKRSWPPVHFQCRSLVHSLTEKEAQRHGIDQRAPPVAPQDGFGAAEATTWVPNMSKFPPGLARGYKRGK